MHALKHINLVAHDNDLLRIVSKDIIQNTKHLLPDLRNVTIFTPKQYSQTILQNVLVEEASEQGLDAILLPNVCTLKQWAHQRSNYNKPLLSQYGRELILVDAIKQQSDLFSDTNPWAIANELLTLFDEMLLNDVTPSEFDKFYKHQNTELSHALLHESDLIKILWQAWRDQIQHENYIDPIEAYALALKNLNPDHPHIYYCVALSKLAQIEQDFINKLSDRSKLSFFAYASDEELTCYTDEWLDRYIDSTTTVKFSENRNDSAVSNFINEAFKANDISMKQRAEQFVKKHAAQSISSALKVYKSNRFEQHAKAIDIQIRLWMNENIQDIGVVTTDRKLIRRLRALLEHANVTVNDPGGWALATTSAAVVVEWWLQIVEENYPAKQLVSLARSPFFPVKDTTLHLQALNYFEKEVILRKNIRSGLKHYREFIDKLYNYNESREVKVKETIFEYLLSLLDTFESSLQKLAKIQHSKKYSLQGFLSELINSLKPIGLYTKLKDDEAGIQIIDVLETQAVQFKLIENNMNWSECRRFISRILDQQNFKPPTHLNNSNSKLTFLSLEQSYLQKFDALIIASVDKNSFPSSNNHYVFFNEQVRRECSVPTWRDDRTRQLHQFRCLLASSPRLLITMQTEKNGELIHPSPWLEAIETFYNMAYGASLSNTDLEFLASQNTSNVIHTSKIPMTEATQQPTPILIDDLIPTTISISQYQSLVNCPYQYFALSCLELSPTEDLQEELTKADFGSLVHESIHAFFVDVPSLPGPFTGKVSEHNHIKATELLLGCWK